MYDKGDSGSLWLSRCAILRRVLGYSRIFGDVCEGHQSSSVLRTLSECVPDYLAHLSKSKHRGNPPWVLSLHKPSLGCFLCRLCISWKSHPTERYFAKPFPITKAAKLPLHFVLIVFILSYLLYKLVRNKAARFRGNLLGIYLDSI